MRWLGLDPSTDSLGRWSAPEAIYRVTQRPHYYETILFRITAAILIVAALVLTYLWRVRYLIRQSRIILEERQIERETIARDLHDTFLQGVQGLVLKFHTGTQQLPENSAVRSSFGEALKLADNVMYEGRNVLTRLHIKRVGAQRLKDTFIAIAAEFRMLSGAQLEVVEIGETRELNTVVLEELTKIGREAIFNSFRHANSTRIHVETVFGLQCLRLSFRDNGIGIDPATIREGGISGHYGLSNLKGRALKIRSRIEFRSKPGEGTEIEIRVPARIAFSVRDELHTYHWFRSFFRRRVL